MHAFVSSRYGLRSRKLTGVALATDERRRVNSTLCDALDTVRRPVCRDAFPRAKNKARGCGAIRQLSHTWRYSSNAPSRLAGILFVFARMREPQL